MTKAISVDVADLDGDTKPDLVVTNYGRDEILLYQNNYPNWIKHTIADVQATFAYCGDMDGDGTLDVVACLYSARKMVWYENNHPTWTQHIIDENTDNADYFLVVDIDGDDILDVVTAGGRYGGDIVWYENNHPDWTEHIIDSGVNGTGVLSFTDIDGDGLRDIVVTMVNAHDVVWYKNEDNGLTWTKYTIDDSINRAWGLSTGDIDGDGLVDIVVTTGGPYYGDGNNVVWYENNHPAWTKHIIDTDLNKANIVAVTDVDGDGTMDVIANGFGAYDVVWYENNHPTWTKHFIDTNLEGPRVFFITDVDGDNIKDLIVPAMSNLVWYKNPTLGVEDVTSSIPTEFELYQSYPNPFNPTTTIHYILPKESVVTITIYDMLGKAINRIISQKLPSGKHSIRWNGDDNNGNLVGTGIYFYQIQAGDYVNTKKMLLMK